MLAMYVLMHDRANAYDTQSTLRHMLTSLSHTPLPFHLLSTGIRRARDQCARFTHAL
jgi:hypothetical protein